MALLNDNLQVQRWLAPKLEIIVEEIMKGIDELNDEKIKQIVYSYNPQEYERTPDGVNFASAWEVKQITSNVGDCKAQGEFGYEPNKMMLDASQYQHGNAYSKNPEDADVREKLAHIIYGGINGKYGISAGDWFGTGPWTQERDAWTALNKAIGKTRMRKWIKAGAKRAGLKIKF